MKENSLAKYNLAECYELGIIVDRNINKAFEFYKEFAEKWICRRKIYTWCKWYWNRG